MSVWCLYTGRSKQDYLDSTGYEHDAFFEEANKYRKKGVPI